MRISVLDIDRIQDERRRWAEKNFGEQSSAQMVMGITEEVGELAHHQLKMEQGIRGSDDEHRAQLADAVGDIVMYLMGFCDTHGFDFSACVEQAWEVIKDRDWVGNPQDGTVHTEARKDSPMNIHLNRQIGSSFEAAQAQGEKRFNRGDFQPRPENPAVSQLREKIRELERPIDNAPQA